MSETTTPRERPILMSGPLVREILAGRKSQTRRPVKRPGDPEFWAPRRPGVWETWSPDLNETIEIACPYGAPRDRLWVRETWFELCDQETVKTYDPPRYGYRATWEDEEPLKVDGDGFTAWRKDGTARSPWRPGIHMPRRACRLVLEVADVRVQCLREITEEDARAEGVADVAVFAAKWDEIYGACEWARSPWVWAISFRRIQP